MKRILATLLLAALPTLAAWSQTTETDSAQYVVDRYLRMLNFDGLPADSMLVLETTITFNRSDDTVHMRRWYAAPQQLRVEVWQDGKLQTGLNTNGKDRFRHYTFRNKGWESINAERFAENLKGYDFRGPLYRWREQGAELTWSGTTLLKGQPLQVVKVVCPGMFTRHYMFDPQNGLLTLIIETDEASPDNMPNRDGHIEWKAIHEYFPVAGSLIVSQESFMRRGALTILNTTARLTAVDPDLFNHD